MPRGHAGQPCNPPRKLRGLKKGIEMPTVAELVRSKRIFEELVQYSESTLTSDSLSMYIFSLIPLIIEVISSFRILC